nr:flagellin [uncultured Desulfuromonas sp.]
MALTINTNVASLNAQRNLGKSQNDLNQSMQRLSSGLRINSAKDDAAGLAISDRMTAQITGLNQAVRNANDGISLSQTAEGALQESTNILQRIRELAVQSANDTNSSSDRESLQAEVDQLIEELDRIADTTQFNGKNLLDGTMTDATFQVGANAGASQTISFSIDSAETSKLSAVGTVIEAPNGDAVVGTDVSGSAIAAGALVVNGTAIGDTDGTNSSLADAINTAAGENIATAVNVQAIEFTDVDLVAGGATATGSEMTGATAGGGDLTIGDGTTQENVAASADAAELATNIETAATAAGITVTATASESTSGTDLNTWVDVTASAATQVTPNTAVTQALTAADDLNINGTNVGTVATGSGDLAGDIAAAIETAADTAAGGTSDITVSVANSTSGSLGTFNTEVSSSGDTAVYTFTVEGVDMVSATGLNSDTLTAAEFDTAMQGHADVTDNGGGSFTYDDGAGNVFSWTGTAAAGDLTITNSDGSDLTITETFTLNAETVTGGFNNGTTTTDDYYGSLTIDSASGEAIDLTGSSNAAYAGFTGAEDVASADRTFSLTVEGVDLFTGDTDGVTAADIDAAITANADALTAAGVTVSGAAVDGDLELTKADGSTLDIVQTQGDGSAGTQGFTSISNDGTTDSYYGSVTITSDTDFTIAGTSTAASGLTANDYAASGVGTYSVVVGGTSVSVGSGGSTVTAQDVVDAINNDATLDAAGYSAALTDEGAVEISLEGGASFTLSESIDADGNTVEDATAAQGLADIDASDTTLDGQISLDSTSDISIEEVTDGALASAGLSAVGNATTTIDQVDVSTREGATTAISSVDAALAQIDTIRGDLGAVQNRFESTIANLQNVSENLSAARSRILDADIAEETSNMTKQNILQQAGVSILAQANQAPQLALSLLG